MCTAMTLQYLTQAEKRKPLRRPSDALEVFMNFYLFSVISVNAAFHSLFCREEHGSHGRYWYEVTSCCSCPGNNKTIA